ncbi:hypothetical protein [Parasediminibacterium sp. JCM 36343]|uniref:hypothetical protein n=1 Tax=Parasediminibacterium sp. JCM 36343 TaxID=3374279 RepID=UPI00397A88D9
MKKIIAVSLFTLLAAMAASAQPNPGGPGTNGNGTTNDLGNTPAVPFDGGMSLILLASGIGYGAKRMKKK